MSETLYRSARGRTVRSISSLWQEESSSSRPRSRGQDSTYRNVPQREPLHIEQQTIRSTFRYVRTDTVSSGYRVTIIASEIYRCCGRTRIHGSGSIALRRLHNFRGHSSFAVQSSSGNSCSSGGGYTPGLTNGNKGHGDIYISFKRFRRYGDDESSSRSRFRFIRFIRAGIKRNPQIKRKFSRYIERVRGSPLFPWDIQ